MNNKNIKRALLGLVITYIILMIIMVSFIITRNSIIWLVFISIFIALMLGFWILVVAPIVGQYLYHNILTQRQKEYLRRYSLLRFFLNINREGRSRDDR